MSRNRLIGGTLLVAGTTIGAGMLALPTTAYGLGFIWSIALLAAMWLFMYYAASVTADLSLHYGKGLTTAALARKTFGPTGEAVASFSFLFLFYALLTAYTVGGSSILGSILRSNLAVDLPPPTCMVIFTLVFGGIVTTTMTGMDYLNRFLFILKVGAFGGMALWLLPKISPDLLVTSETQGTFQAWHLAIPILFTSFGFHGSIPSLMNYLKMNRGHLKIVFLVGSLIPLLVYVLWLAITIGTLSPDVFTAIIAKGGDLGSLVTALNEASGSKSISVFTDLFAGIGVITSYMGVGIGVVDFYKEQFERNLDSVDGGGFFKFMAHLRLNKYYSKILDILILILCIRLWYRFDTLDYNTRIILYVLLGMGFFVRTFFWAATNPKHYSKYLNGVSTFAPPLFLGILYPQGFIAALGYAAIALSMLAVILPAMIAIKVKVHTSSWKLYLLLATGIGIVLIEILHKVL